MGGRTATEDTMLKALKGMWDLISGKALREYNKKLYEDTLRRDARMAVAMTAPDDPYLSTGRYVTTEDLERERAELGEFPTLPAEMLRPNILWPEEQEEEHRRSRPPGRVDAQSPEGSPMTPLSFL